MRTVIFDLDGTLADTSADLIDAANSCFRTLKLGDLLDPADDASTAFRGARAMLRLGFSRIGVDDEGAVETQYPKLLEAYRDGIDRRTTLYPGALDAIEILRSRGYAVGVCTNKPEDLAELLLTRLGVRNVFASMVGANTLPVRKPDPAPYLASVTRAGGDPRRSCLIGDTETDRETARAAGVPCVLVTFGPDGDGVADLAPEALLPDYAALPRVVSNLIG